MYPDELDDDDQEFYDYQDDRVCSYPCEFCGEEEEDDDVLYE